MTEEGNATILLVDDEEHLLIALRDFLNFEGYEVRMARSGEEALDRLKEIKPDLIILDVSMPGIGGMGFLNKATGGDHPLKSPVLVLTARSNLGDFFESTDVAGFMSKPCRKDDLLRMIRDILARHAKTASRERQGGKIHVLLGEDDSRVSELLVRQFRNKGYKVTLATTGPEVVERAPIGRPDVVVMKGILTRMNGDAVAALLKAMPSTSAIPVVLYDPQLACMPGMATPHGVDRLVRSRESVDLIDAIRHVTGSGSKNEAG